MESIVRNTFALVDMVEKNKAMQALVQQAEKAAGSGRWLERIPDPKVATRFNLSQVAEQVRDSLEAAGVDDIPDNLDEALDGLVTVFTPATFAKGDEQIVTVIRDGRRQFWQVNNTELYDAITAIGPRDTSALVRFLEAPARVLRAGATLTPGFITRNPGRDTIVAFLQSRYGFIPVYDTMRGLIAQVRGDEDAKLFFTSGVGQAALHAQDRRSRQRIVERLQQGPRDRVRSIITHPIDLLRGVGEWFEVATRLGEFKLALDAGGVERGIAQRLLSGSRPDLNEETLTRATLGARDVTTDFSRGGSLSKEINRYEAFFNARVQGYVRIAETARENPVGLSLKLGTLALLSAALWFMNEDDDKYRELEEWEKHTYWHVKIPGANRWLRIPKPFEFGYVPDVVEAALEYAKEGSAERFASMRQSLVGNSPGQVFVNLIPTGLLPMVEAWANYDSFRDTNIVRPWDLDLPTDLQYTDWTSETAKKLGKVIPVAPAILDHLIYGYTAGFGRGVVSGIDQGLRVTGQAPTKGLPSAPSQQLPVVGNYLRDRSFGASARSIQDIYDLSDAIATVEQGVKADRKHGDIESAKARIADARADLPWQRRGAILSARQQLKDLSPRIKAIYAAPPARMTPAQKRQQLDRIYEQMVAISRRALGRTPLAASGASK
jgi:hypothetical protein